MKKYQVNINHNATESVEIIASTEAEAIEKACKIKTPLEDLDFDEPSVSIISSEDAPEYDIIEDAKEVVKTASENDTTIELNDEVEVTVLNDDTATVDSVVWDDTEGQIIVVFNDYTEHTLQDLTGDSVIELCGVIIDSEPEYEEDE